MLALDRLSPSAMASSWTLYAGCIVSVVALSAVWSFVAGRSASHADKATSSVLAGPLASVWLYSDREDFLLRLFGPPHRLLSRAADRLNTTFGVNRYRVTITANASDAATFANDRRLHLTEAYLVLFTAVPDLPEWISGVLPDALFQRRGRRAVAAIKDSTSSERIAGKIPHMIDDVVTQLCMLPKAGAGVHTHDVIYPIMFRMVIRMFGLSEHTKDFATMDRINDWTMQVAETSNSFLTTQFPFIPTPWSVKRLLAGLRLSVEVSRLLKARERTGVEHDDYIQDMMRRGVPRNEVRDFVLGSLVGGVANPGALSSYTLIFLGSSPELLAQVKAEVVSALDLDVAEVVANEGSEGLRRALKSIPLSTWDDKLPLLDDCVKETSRLLISDLLVRRFRPDPELDAKEPELRLSGRRLEDKDFAAFWLSSLHYNPTIYSDPTRYDPSRWARGEGSGKDEFGAFGVGRHPCPGIRFARVGVKVAVALWLLSMEGHEAVDASGTRYTLDTAPKPRHNDEHRRLPAKPVTLQYAENLLHGA
ncbi:uncharacterized protein PFL1_06339 [Pseudozyma flocculosa PF-1]|uniref:Cytochrome P450 n=2 Tax=Pseudozyma flocculosa TaxID=84751 RepID=A0A5C3F8I2_9BASI|nr:uncharacterized protein PFL1_06339 [Pseudozyma flocculosa PF-1]EPQ26131.1 hypothetical protein PFL1_06339 [Pseudozyma flocculosa PF-1]SPO40376.1 uncharacterized protein PSFLO_05858 [Pseudozyma flocculosa]